MGELVQNKRRKRSDCKKDIKPTIDLQLKDSIYRLAYVVRKPVKTVCEDMIHYALFETKAILIDLSCYLKRELIIENTVYVGNSENEELYSVLGDENGRISFRMKQNAYEVLYSLAYAFHCSVSRMAAVLLYECITDADFIEFYINEYLESLNKERRRELKALLKYIRKETNESLTFADLLGYLVDVPYTLTWTLPDK